MEQQDIPLLDGFWERLDEKIRGQKISKSLVAQRCGFDRKILYKPKQGNRYMRVVYFARLCAELNISADYLLFGKEGRHV